MPHPFPQKTRPPNSPRPGGSRDRRRAAGRDAILWAGVAVWLLSLLPSLVGVLSPDATLTWTDEFNDVPILLVALMAIAISRHGAEEHGERVFWGLLMGYPGAWLVARVLYLVVPYNGNGILSDQVTDLS